MELKGHDHAVYFPTKQLGACKDPFKKFPHLAHPKDTLHLGVKLNCKRPIGMGKCVIFRKKGGNPVYPKKN